MTAKTAAAILAEIATLLADNTVGEITAADLRQVVADIADSYYNTTDTSVVRVLSVQGGGSTNDSSSGSGAYVDHDLTYTIAANYLILNRVLRVTAQFKINTGATAPDFSHRLKVGASALAEISSVTPSTTIADDQITVIYEIQARAAPSASSAVEGGLICPPGGGLNNAANRNIVSTPVNLATNGTLALAISTKWSTAGVGTNTAQLTRFVVEALN